MKRLHLLIALGAAQLAAGCLSAADARYSVETFGDVVQLRDTQEDVVVSVLTPVSNAYEMVVKGENVIRMRIASVDEMRARPGLNGIPLMSPFANRLDETAFYANGRKYNFDLELGNVRAPIPIHGYLMGANAWTVSEVKADETGAWVTSTLDFYRVPEYMAQFPFAHTLTMTYRLADGALEVHTRIDNLSDEPMPVAIGFHPYFQLTDSTRNEWTISAPAATHWVLGPTKIPTGEKAPAETFWGGDPRNISLADYATRDVDDVFSDLERDADGRATFSMSGVKQTLSVTVGPNYRTMLVYTTAPRPPAQPGPNRGTDEAGPPPVSAGPPVPLSARDTTPSPAERGFVAFEPMAGITNSMNLAHKGLYDELQSVPPRGHWEESFWISTSGY